jgi:hypothetical protein
MDTAVRHTLKWFPIVLVRLNQSQRTAQIRIGCISSHLCSTILRSSTSCPTRWPPRCCHGNRDVSENRLLLISDEINIKLSLKCHHMNII